MDYSEPIFQLYSKVSSKGTLCPKQHGTVFGILNHSVFFQGDARAKWDETFPGWQTKPVYYVKTHSVGHSHYHPSSGPAQTIIFVEDELEEYDWTSEIEKSVNDEHSI